MHPITVLFGLGCAATCWFAAQSRDPDAKVLSWFLVYCWLSLNLAWYADMQYAFPAFDLSCGILALIIMQTRRVKWVALFTQLIGVRMVLHVLEYLTGHVFTVPYLHALNATFVCMLAVVAYPGGGNARDNLLGRFRRFRQVVLGSQSRAAGGLGRGQ